MTDYEAIGAQANAEIAQLEADVASLTRQLVDASNAVQDAERRAADSEQRATDLATQLAKCQAGIEVPPTPVPVAKTRYGSAAGGPGANNKAQVDQANTVFGGIDVLRAFEDGPMPSSWSSTAKAQYAPPGCAVIISAKEDIKAYAQAAPGSAARGAVAGRWKSNMRSVADNIETIWVPFHEPEDNIEAGQFTVAQYKVFAADVAAWAVEVNNERKQRNAKPLTSSSILMSWTLNPKSGRKLEDYYVDALTMIGFDCYSEDNAKLLVAYVNTHPDKDWLVGEFGPLKADMLKPIPDDQIAKILKSMVEIFKGGQRAPKYVSYFQSSQAANYILTPETRPLSTAYIRSLCQQS